MGLSSVKVKGIKKTANEIVIAASVDDHAIKHFVINDMPNDSVFDKTAKANKTSIVLSDGTILHDMYDLDKLWYHGQAARQHMYPYEAQFDYQHVYKRPLSGLSSLAKLGDTLYALEGLSEEGHAYTGNELYKWLINDNGWNVPPTQKIATMLYYVGSLSALPGISALSTTYNFNEELLSTEGVWPTSAMLGVKYNTLYEIPGSIKQDYSKGELIANSFKTKNQYDESWSMQKPDSDYGLSAARCYTEVHSCGSTLWLKYKMSESYSSTDVSAPATPAYSREIYLSANDSNELVDELPGIEVIARVNRGADASEHKSTLYALDLYTELLDGRTLLPENCLSVLPVKCKYDPSADISTVVDASYTLTQEDEADGIELHAVNAVVGIDEAARSKIKATIANELKNCIRRLAESIAPANCQLFSVTTNN